MRFGILPRVAATALRVVVMMRALRAVVRMAALRQVVGMATASARILFRLLIAKLHVLLCVWHWILVVVLWVVVSVNAHHFGYRLHLGAGYITRYAMFDRNGVAKTHGCAGDSV